MVGNSNGQLTRSRDRAYRQSLQDKTRKQLAELARRQGIPGWHPMRKAELIDALADAAGRTNGSRHKAVGTKSPGPAHAGVNGVGGQRDDVLIAKPVSSRWLSARWNVSPEMLTRAESALGSDWHRAKMVLRLSRITDDNERPTSESRVRDTVVKLETGECCVEIDQPGLPYRLHLGFSIPGGEFFALSHSDSVSTPRGPRPEESRRPNTSTISAGNSLRSASSLEQEADGLPLVIHTDLVVYGRTAPETLIELEKDSVRVGRDGRFELRLPLENGRQFVPATATAGDRTSQRRVALAIERHLKLLDPEPTEEQT